MSTEENSRSELSVEAAKNNDLDLALNVPENDRSNLFDLVVVGSSAGGVDALLVLVSHLPADFPAPIVIAQHLDPHRPSSLAPILQRRTSLKIVTVENKEALEKGVIYVVPANRHVLIMDDHVEVFDDSNRPKPSVDLLLSTAADVYGDHLIAVILTGTGSDGAAGGLDVKNAGGTVIVQNPNTARYPSMPNALPANIVDFETDIEQIGPLLYNLLQGVEPDKPENSTESLLQEILAQITRRSDIDFRQYKTSTIMRRISRRMNVTHHRSMSDYRLYLETHPEEITELVKAFLINVTQFFRDTEAFNYLKEEVLPRLIYEARSNNHVLRLWSAGCATGEEPYSLAMLIVDALGTELSEWSVKIFATDLDEAAISFARRGFYTDSHLKNVSPEYRSRFFEATESGYRVSKNLRQMVIFGQQDLSRSAPFPRINLVVCRNVLIYFTVDLQEYVLNQFAFSLAPDGFLFLGKAETIWPNHNYFELISKQWKIYRSINTSLSIGRRAALFDLSSRPSLQETRTIVEVNQAGSPSYEQDGSPGSELTQLRRFNEVLLRFLAGGVVIIDRNYRLLTINAAARRLLGLRETGNDQDFLHTVRGIPYNEVRAAIDTVFRERTNVNLAEIELKGSQGGNGRYLSFSIALMQIEAGNVDLAAINIHDVSDQVLATRQLEVFQNEQTQLMSDLRTANRRLGDMNKELEDANEELQVANEELVLTHEELQATIEEFETTNEELQATNEELETNNEELQATNEELQTTNEELRARTAELQEMTEEAATKSDQLNQIVETTPSQVIVLSGPELRIEAFPARYLVLLNGRKVHGQPLEKVGELFGEATESLVRSAGEVFESGQPHRTESLQTAFPDQNGRAIKTYFVYSLAPWYANEERVAGVIIYASQVDE